MKTILRSSGFIAYTVAILAVTIAFFGLLHSSIIRGDWPQYTFVCLLYPAAMYGLGSFFGCLVKTDDYHGLTKAFHVSAFIVVNGVQLVWAVGYAPKNLCWIPVFVAVWGCGLWRHLAMPDPRRAMAFMKIR